jgi:hypothetical protein
MATIEELGRKLREKFTEHERDRAGTERKWIEDLRQCKGIYDPDVQTELNKRKGGSKVYTKYTKSKESPLKAKLTKMLFPTSDKNWSIALTPKPDIGQVAVQQILMSLVMQGVEPTADIMEKEIKTYAQERCDAMEETMDDQLSELSSTRMFEQVIGSFIRYGTGILKGPLSRAERKAVNGGGVEESVETEYTPMIEYVQNWYVYPDMGTTELSQCEHIFELHCMSRREVLGLMKRPDFDAEVIKEYLSGNPTGDYRQRDWETNLTLIDTERIDGETTQTRRNSDKYEVLECWGYVSRATLEDIGIDTAGVDEDYTIAYIWLLGDKVIKVDLNPIAGGEFPYYFFYYDKDETSIWGEGLPRVIRDTQAAHCSIWRAALDNAALVAIPQFEVDMDMLSPGQDMEHTYAGKVYQVSGNWSQGGGGRSAIKQLDFKSNIGEYLELIQKCEDIGDSESSLPAALFGDMQHNTNETARGVSIRQGNLNIVIDGIVRNFDRANEDVLKALYLWNKTYNPDPKIKGDYEIIATGSSSLMAKEVLAQSLDAFITNIYPIPQFQVQIKDDILQDIMKSRDLPDKYRRTPEEVEMEKQKQMMAAQQQAMMTPPSSPTGGG